MDFDLTEEQRLARQTARDFATRAIEPIAAELDKQARWPAEIVTRLGTEIYEGTSEIQRLVIAKGALG